MQGLSYAALALVDPVVGFYTTIFPTLVYMLFGTSRECHIGPFALVALLTASAILTVLPDPANVTDLTAPIETFGIVNDDYQAAALNTAAALSLLVGCFQVLFGVLGVGQVVMSIISDPFVSGFTTGSAFTIATSQLGGLFGVPGCVCACVRARDVRVGRTIDPWQVVFISPSYATSQPLVARARG